MSPRTAPDLQALEAFAHKLADASGRAILPHFRKAIAVENKAGLGFDPVTEADKAAERAIRELLAATYPDHGILGEEEGHQPGTNPLTWVIDPIDGTRAFMTGTPLWGTLIALNDGTGPVLGVLDQPFLGERFIGHSGESWFHACGERRRLETRPCADLGSAILSSTHPEIFKAGAEMNAFMSVTRRVRMSRYGGDCYAYGLLAMGFLDIIIEASLKPYDIQALIPVIEGAGGIITDWVGGNASQGGRIVACGDARLHAQALTILSEAPAA